MVARKYEIDMSKGSIFRNMLAFAFPLMLTNILQLLYNAADLIVVGRWAENGAICLAAVGATSTLTVLITNLFIGFSIGASVVVSKKYGAHDVKGISDASHTAVAVGAIGGIAAFIIGQAFCRPILELLGTPPEVIDLSVKYMRVIFIGIPAQLLYNFGAAILRAVGDTRRPLYILATTGIVNVILNIILVVGCHMDVAGVAAATTVSHYLSALVIMYSLMNSDTIYRINIKGIRIVKSELKQIMAIGIPASIQASVFSLSNLAVQSAVNAFGAATMAGRTAAANLESFVYTAMDSFYQATLTGVSQNYGAKQEKRIYKTIGVGLASASFVGLVLGVLVFAFGKPLLGLYIVDSPEAIAEGMKYIIMCGLPYFICGAMNVTTGALRGLGCSKTPAVNSLLGACGFRILWVFLLLPIPKFHNVWFLYLCWPVSWTIVIVMNLITFAAIRKKSMEKMYVQ